MFICAYFHGETLPKRRLCPRYDHICSPPCRVRLHGDKMFICSYILPEAQSYVHIMFMCKSPCRAGLHGDEMFICSYVCISIRKLYSSGDSARGTTICSLYIHVCISMQGLCSRHVYMYLSPCGNHTKVMG
ncbi:hypothetical protein Taro_007813 [Colocasia esculenta]|uniref:Uncharacterized protein n=1 Tax=Colocasia esculenta TaxID=4460 RepID=A0A843U020_COLES|nr:hypothetical protein [Colocasia esculenta]